MDKFSKLSRLSKDHLGLRAQDSGFSSPGSTITGF